VIDKVKLQKQIILETSKFSSKFFHYKNSNLNKITGEIYDINCYKYKNDIVSIIYSPKTNLLKIEGRLINLLYSSNKVHNFDDYINSQFYVNYQEDEVIEYDNDYLRENNWYELDDGGNDVICFPPSVEYIPQEPIIIEERLEKIIKNINGKIYELIGVRVNVLSFKVTYLEVCFNIWLENNYVNKYIELFNMIYAAKNDKRYKNYVLEKNLLPYTSFYVKPKGQYRNNLNSNYTINFYNKRMQLEYLINSSKYNYKISKEDLEISTNVLRLEVQLGYYYLNKVCKEYNLNRTFMEFIDLELCLSILVDKYRFFISQNEKLDFYSYRKAKEIIENTDFLKLQEKRNLLNHIREKYQYNKKHSNSTVKKYKDLLEKLGIHYYFLPTKWGVDYLQSPIKLLINKIEKLNEIDYKSLMENFTFSDYINGYCTLEDLPSEVRDNINNK
jgi:hypothetical protein